MLGKLWRALGLGRTEAAIADAVVTRVADSATGGAATKIEDAVEAVDQEVKRRKRKK